MNSRSYSGVASDSHYSGARGSPFNSAAPSYARPGVEEQLSSARRELLVRYIRDSDSGRGYERAALPQEYSGSDPHGTGLSDGSAPSRLSWHPGP